MAKGKKQSADEIAKLAEQMDDEQVYELFVTFTNLTAKNPICVLSEEWVEKKPLGHKGGGADSTNVWTIRDQTEIRSVRPTRDQVEFLVKFELDFLPKEKQRLKFDLYDSNTEKPPAKLGEPLGHFTTEMTTLAKTQKVTEKLSGKKAGKTTGTVIAEDLVSILRDEIDLLFSADLSKLKTKQPTAVLVVSKVSTVKNDDSYIPVYQSEVASASATPTWEKFTLDVKTLCNFDVDRALLIEVYHCKDKAGNMDILGECYTNLKKLSAGKCTFALEVDGKKVDARVNLLESEYYPDNEEDDGGKESDYGNLGDLGEVAALRSKPSQGKTTSRGGVLIPIRAPAGNAPDDDDDDED